MTSHLNMLLTLFYFLSMDHRKKGMDHNQITFGRFEHNVL